MKIKTSREAVRDAISNVSRNMLILQNNMNVLGQLVGQNARAVYEAQEGKVQGYRSAISDLKRDVKAYQLGLDNLKQSMIARNQKVLKACDEKIIGIASNDKACDAIIDRAKMEVMGALSKELDRRFDNKTRDILETVGAQGGKRHDNTASHP
jgi:chromosome segregation ATPase